jgi:hypothetical protein
MAQIADHTGVVVGVRPPSVLQPADHYILKKLANQLLPWMIGGLCLRRLWIVRLAAVYSYTSDLSAALAGLGIGAPLASLISGKAEGKSAFDAIRETLPPQWFVLGAVALLVWLGLRLVVQREDVIARALLAKECAQSMSALRVNLIVALNKPDPMADIVSIQKSVEDQVQNAIRNKVWPTDWDPFPPNTLIAKELAAKVAEIRSKFMPSWNPPPTGAA